MDKQFNPRKYGMMACPLCDGYGRIQSPRDVRVCRNCGGFGFIREEVESLDQEGKPIISGPSQYHALHALTQQGQKGRVRKKLSY